MTEYKLLKDWNPQVGDVFETEHGYGRTVGTSNTAFNRNGVLQDISKWNVPVRRVSRATPGMSKNERAYAFLSDADKQVLRDADEVLVLYGQGWEEKHKYTQFWDNAVYRTKPKPQRINVKDLTGTIELDDDGKPNWDSYED